jgi:hypothetical protein
MPVRFIICPPIVDFPASVRTNTSKLVQSIKYIYDVTFHTYEGMEVKFHTF